MSVRNASPPTHQGMDPDQEHVGMTRSPNGHRQSQLDMTPATGCGFLLPSRENSVENLQEKLSSYPPPLQANEPALPLLPILYVV